MDEFTDLMLSVAIKRKEDADKIQDKMPKVSVRSRTAQAFLASGNKTSMEIARVLLSSNPNEK